MKGIELVKEDERHVWVKSAGGENWHDLVVFCISNHWGGIENLSLIPGTVGAAPMQNIGAYGVEIKDVFESLEAVDMETGTVNLFNPSDCDFGYRESVFKKALKGRYFIASVTLKLSKAPIINIKYGDIAQWLHTHAIENPGIEEVSQAVIAIRQSKLPDPKRLGNAGSFFKNPVIALAHYKHLSTLHPEIKGYPLSDEHIKVAAGWLIEQAGWKGKRMGEVGVHQHQALVLVNYGKGSGKDVLDLAKAIIADIKQKFEIDLTPEVNIL